MEHFKDKVAVITGSGRGIGRNIALTLAREGVKVVVTSRTPVEIEPLAREINSTGGRAIAIRADLTIEEDIRHLIRKAESEFNQIDILINNAGILKLAPITETTSEIWDEMMITNLKAVFIACREVLPGMMMRRSGRIINIGSMAGRRGYVEQGAYCASKHGLIGLSKVLALETQKFGIRVHVLAPGGVMTDLSKELRESRGGVDENAWMTTEEVARAVVYLCSQDGAAFTDELTLRRFESEPWR